MVPANSFAEYGPEPNPQTNKKDVVWFALNEDRPLFAFAGIWTTFNRDRGTKPVPGPHHARFPKWVINGPDGLEIGLPLFPRKRTQVGHRAMSVSCQTQTWRIESRKGKSRPKAAPNSQLPISKLGGHQQRGSLQLEELLQEGLNVLMGFVRRRFLVVAARKPFFIARIAWRNRLLRLDV